MNTKKYKQATKYFGIPVPGYKDGIWPELELLKWQMVENLLLAAMRGNVNAVFREGDMTLKQDVDGTYSVRLSATGNEPSAQGAVGGAYFDAPSSVLWSGLEVGRSYFLYLKGTVNTFQNEKDVVPVASVFRMTTKFVTLIAKVDLRGDKFSVDRNPSGKVNARDLAQHVLDYENPHGDKMVQDELLVRNHLAIGDENDADIELTVNGVENHFPVSKLVSALTTTRVVVDFISAGNKGVTLTGIGKVVFASVVRADNNPDLSVGEISIGFYGISSEVNRTDQIIVSNSGDVGVSMRAIIICE